MPLTTGDLLADRYLLGEVLGSGGMAQVYRAEDQILHRRVAVKVLRESTDHDTDRSRFASEARILAGLAHPGLVTVLDAGISAVAPFLVMELVEGHTLAERCRNGHLPEDTVADLGRQLGGAIAFAHSRDVIHRDLKPGNVLITSAGRVKLADFGIARLIGDTARHTQTGQAIGTAAYFAPEQVTGEELTTATDVYSFGLVLLEALTGERAYSGPATEAALARLSRPPHIPDSLSPMWRQLLRAMTLLDPTKRPSAAEVAAILAGPPSQAPVVGDAPHTAVLTQPMPTPATPTTLSESPSQPAGEPPPSSQPWIILGLLAAAVVALVVIFVGVSNQDPDRPSPRPVPSDVPPDLQAPLQDLHDAIEEAR